MQIQTVDKYEGYIESTEPIDALNILPLTRFEPFIYMEGYSGYRFIYMEGYSESTEPILPLARFEPTTSATSPSTTPDTDATNGATETSTIKGVLEVLILTTTDAEHVVYWFFFNGWHLFRSQVKA